MSVIGSFDRTRLFAELADPTIMGPTGTVSATTNRNTAFQNLTGNSGAVAATLGTLGNAAALAATPGTGFTGGAAVVLKSACMKFGDIYYTRIMFDITDLQSSTTDLDVIGQSTTPAFYAKLTAAEVGTTILMFSVTCLEAPATGVTDIDFWSAPEGTAVFDDAGGTALTEKILITAGGAWTNGAQKGGVVVPAATDYLYLVNGAAGTVGTYTAGKFLVEMYGYD